MANGIAYQNKDIIFKLLSENYKNKSLKVYGLDLPPIKEVLPTNLPAIQLDEKRSDNIFLLEGNTILILEYESDSSNKNLIKYGHYAFRVAETYCKDVLYKIVIAVIYTSDIQTAPYLLDLGCMQLQINQVFLSEFDGNQIYDELKTKVHHGEPLTDEDVMQFIILPLTKNNNKQKMIENAVNLAKEINDDAKQGFIIAGILSSTDKFIDKEYSKKVKEWLKMTKVAQLYEEEKIEAVNVAINSTKQDTKTQIARKMLENDEDILSIMKYTGLTKTQIIKLQETTRA